MLYLCICVYKVKATCLIVNIETDFSKYCIEHRYIHIYSDTYIFEQMPNEFYATKKHPSTHISYLYFKIKLNSIKFCQIEILDIFR